MRGRQAVVETDMGTVVLQLLPEIAPNHVGHFMKLAGGLKVLAPEFSRESFTAGAVGGVLVPGDPNSAGAQFFICATDQVALDGQYTLFARVVEGLEVVQQISAVDADERNAPRSRIAIRSVTIRDTPPVPFIGDTAAELARYRVLLETLQPEFSDTPNVPGVVSMARGEDPASGTTSFFICLGECRSLDGQYTVFARVASGMDVVNRMAAVDLDGETPRTPVRITGVRVVKNSADLADGVN